MHRFLLSSLAVAVLPQQGRAQYYALDASWPKIPGTLNLSSITAVAVANGTAGMEIHVAQRGTAAPPIIVFDAAGNLLRTQGADAIVTPHGMKAQSGTPSTLWVTDVGDFTVKQVNISGGLLATAGTPGKAGSGVNPAQFSSPADIAITPVGNVVISDGDGGINNRVLDLSAGSLNVFYGFGDAGSGPGQFSSPHSIAFEPEYERLWVADRGNARIQVFLAVSGLFVGEITDCFAPGIPWGVRIDAANSRVIVADGTNGALYALNVTWGASAYQLGECNLLQNITVGLTDKPHEVDVDWETGDVYLANVGTPSSIQRYKRVQ